MEFNVQIQETWPCNIESAFKTPMLCDVTLIHTGYGLMPRLTHVSDDANWGNQEVQNGYMPLNHGHKKVDLSQWIMFLNV